MELKGIIPPVVTPFQSNTQQNLDLDKLRDCVRYVLKEGVHGILACAGGGEEVHLSLEERIKVLKTCVDEVNGKVPVIAGVFSAGTSNAIRESKQMKDAGTDAILAMLPYYYRPTDEGIFQHFKSIIQEVDIPILLYDLRRFTDYDINPKILMRLAESDRIVGIKESTADIWHISQVIKLCGNRLSVFAGSFDVFPTTMMLGGAGCITGFSNCLPALHVELYEKLRQGNAAKAKELFYKIFPLWEIGPNPPNIKAALNILGHQAGSPRRPLLPTSPETEERLRQALKLAGVL